MKATIKNTTKIVTLDTIGKPMPARIWEGVTESGIPFHLYVTRIAVGVKEDASQFESELQETRSPSLEVEAIPLWLIL